MSVALLDCNDMALLMKQSPRTIQANASRAPHLLPPRVAGLRLLRWHPDAFDRWALEGGTPRKKAGRPRLPT